ncbi:MAG: transcriptional regulator, AsnC family [Alphaproteobacteria bacterium]|jgi:Lrp/AsnC family transcriptional regulator|nr:transcriptional regulator, AsnC family [Alphaproteobacteria bacterium]MDB5740038.1 transcriptional regulator, AsnC family [Alphaproteobacteria bacterium]
MDEIDLKILRILQEDSTTSMVDLALKVGLSHTPCWRRVKQLEESGAIRGRAVLLDPAIMGLSVNVLANIKLKAHDEETLEAFEQAALARPEIVECFVTSGDSDYAVRIVVRSIDEYEHLLKKVLLHFPGVGSVNSHFALKCVKNTTRLPI